VNRVYEEAFTVLPLRLHKTGNKLDRQADDNLTHQEEDSVSETMNAAPATGHRDFLLKGAAASAVPAMVSSLGACAETKAATKVGMVKGTDRTEVRSGITPV